MGKRYEIAPHYDAWMQGDRIGTEVRRTKSLDPDHKGRTIIHLRMEVSGKVKKFWADEVTPR